jgi:hypothetical protein
MNDHLKVGDVIKLREMSARILGATVLGTKWEVVAIDGADLSVREVGKKTETTQWLPRFCVASLA